MINTILDADTCLTMSGTSAGKKDFSPPMVPGEVYRASISLWNTSYVFNKGHQIRVAISSSNYPRFNNNPNDYSSAAANHTGIPANNTVWAGGDVASHLELPVVSLEQLPQSWAKNITEAFSDMPDKISQPILKTMGIL